MLRPELRLMLTCATSVPVADADDHGYETLRLGLL